MLQLGARFWRDDGGALLALEWLFLATLLALGLTTGLVAVRNAVNAELTTVADAVTSLNVCFSFSGLSNCAATTCGSAVTSIPSTFNLLNTFNTPAFGPATAITPTPCAESAAPAVGLPAVGTLGTGGGAPAGNVPPALPTTRPSGVPISTKAAEACVDVEPGGRVRPAATPGRPEDCVDREPTRPGVLDTTPAATRGQPKP
jgi:Flp pilus assembly pilin Flp